MSAWIKYRWCGRGGERRDRITISQREYSTNMNTNSDANTAQIRIQIAAQIQHKYKNLKI